MSSPKGADELSGDGNVSRSGRVRKKSSLLAVYESLDNLDKPKKKTGKKDKVSGGNDYDEDTNSPDIYMGAPPPKKKPGRKSTGKAQHRSFDNGKVGHPQFNNTDGDSSRGNDYEEGDLEIDLPHEFEGEMPELGGEEIVDNSEATEDDNLYAELTRNSGNHGGGRASFVNNKLKSQAQSTYFMEKSFEKTNRKISSHPGSIGGKSKPARKDKGTPRVTAYMLWAKEQREIFSKKYPHMDFSSMSKKLSDMWAAVALNQKKMWKNKAAKIMRKNMNVMENMKRSGPLPPPKGKKPRGRPRIHPIEDDRNGNGEMLPPPSNVGKKSVGIKKEVPKVSPKSTQSAWANKAVVNTKGTKAPGTSKAIVKVNSRGLPPPETNYNSRANDNYRGTSSSKQVSPKKEDDSTMYKVTGTTPMDVAAHFALLGESLSIIGERLKDVEGQAVSGSLSVLMDSLICATGPLLCLSQQVPELNCIPQQRLNRILNNIAYFMPGL